MKKVSRKNHKLAIEHHRIIVGLACRYWKSLPTHAKASIDIDDLISGAVVRVVEVSHKFDKARGASTTFVHHVAENHFRVILNQFRQKKRCAIEVASIDNYQMNLTRPDFNLRFRESRNILEAVLADASAEFRSCFEQFLEERKYRNLDPEVLLEWRFLSRRHGLTRESLQIVLDCV